MSNNDEVTAVCECHSLDHIIRFSLFRKPSQVFVTVHLDSTVSFLQRVWRGMTYAFGKTSRYGDWDELILTLDDAKHIRNVLTSFINVREMEITNDDTAGDPQDFGKRNCGND